MNPPELDLLKKYTPAEFDELKKFYPKLRQNVNGRINKITTNEYRMAKKQSILPALKMRQEMITRYRNEELRKLSDEIHALQLEAKEANNNVEDDDEVEVIISENPKKSHKKAVRKIRKVEDSDDDDDDTSADEEFDTESDFEPETLKKSQRKPRTRKPKQEKEDVPVPVQPPPPIIVQKPSGTDDIRARILERIMQH